MPATAVAPLQTAIDKRDTFAEAHYLLGLVYRDVRNFDAATASLEQALRIEPALTAAREELADLHRAQGRAVDEMQQLQTLATRDGHVTRRVAIALAEARYGQYDGALRTLSEAQTVAPADSRVQVALGRVYLDRAERARDRESVARALNILERALGGTARRSEGLALYGRALALSGDLAGAERLLRDAVATSPVDLEAFQYLADVAERLSHDVVARDALLHLDVLQGDTAEAAVRADRARRIGALSLKAGDPKTSATYLTRAVDAGHDDAGTLGQLARARWLSGDATGARDSLARALQIAPRDAELQRIARMIK
jgi:Flp pilus assembly protein TadD